MSNDPFNDRPGDSSRDFNDAPPPDPSPAGSSSTFDWGGDPDPLAGSRPATVGKRVGAYIIDSVMLAVVFGIVGLVALGSTGGLPATPEAVSGGQTFTWSVITAALTLTYFVFLEAGSGQTLAKRMLRIKVVMADGSPTTLEAALKRRVLFIVGSIIPVVGGLISFGVPLAALITAIQDEPDNQGFHDRWATTKVIEV